MSRTIKINGNAISETALFNNEASKGNLMGYTWMTVTSPLEGVDSNDIKTMFDLKYRAMNSNSTHRIIFRLKVGDIAGNLTNPVDHYVNDMEAIENLNNGKDVLYIEAEFFHWNKWRYKIVVTVFPTERALLKYYEDSNNKPCTYNLIEIIRELKVAVKELPDGLDISKELLPSYSKSITSGVIYKLQASNNGIVPEKKSIHELEMSLHPYLPQIEFSQHAYYFLDDIQTAYGEIISGGTPVIFASQHYTREYFSSFNDFRLLNDFTKTIDNGYGVERVPDELMIIPVDNKINELEKIFRMLLGNSWRKKLSEGEDGIGFSNELGTRLKVSLEMLKKSLSNDKVALKIINTVLNEELPHPKQKGVSKPIFSIKVSVNYYTGEEIREVHTNSVVLFAYFYKLYNGSEAEKAAITKIWKAIQGDLTLVDKKNEEVLKYPNGMPLNILLGIDDPAYGREEVVSGFKVNKLISHNDRISPFEHLLETDVITIGAPPFIITKRCLSEIFCKLSETQIIHFPKIKSQEEIDGENALQDFENLENNVDFTGEYTSKT